MKTGSFIGAGILAALLAVTITSDVGAQGPPPGPPPPPLSETKWETWNNTGLRGIPTNVEPDGPAPRRDFMGMWDPARGGIGARGARGTPAPLTPWGEGVSKTHKSGDGVRMVDVTEINDPVPDGEPEGARKCRRVQPDERGQRPEHDHAVQRADRWAVVAADPDPRRAVVQIQRPARFLGYALSQSCRKSSAYRVGFEGWRFTNRESPPEDPQPT